MADQNGDSKVVDANGKTDTENGHDEEPHDPYYPPIVSLPLVETPSGEDGESEVFKLRSKLYRFDTSADPPEWKERGTGDVRILFHNDAKHYRLLMRREKTLKVCANHFIRPWMLLKPMKGSDKAWMWQVHSDFAGKLRASCFSS